MLSALSVQSEKIIIIDLSQIEFTLSSEQFFWFMSSTSPAGLKTGPWSGLQVSGRLCSISILKKNNQPREELPSFFLHLLPRYPRFALSSGPSAAKPFLKEANLSPHKPRLEWSGFKHWLNCSSRGGGCAGWLQMDSPCLSADHSQTQSSLA